MVLMKGRIGVGRCKSPVNGCNSWGARCASECRETKGCQALAEEGVTGESKD